MNWPKSTVMELQRDGVLLVEDGNHGESRPRPDEFVKRGVAFIRAADMDASDVLFDTASRINDVARKRITKGIGAPGDILLSHKGTVGKVALVPDDAPPFVCSPQTTFWRTLKGDRLDRRYLHAYLRSPYFHQQLASRAGETDMAPYVSLTSQRGLHVLMPDIDIQRRIGSIVGALDAKISVERKIKGTLADIARALFQSWFVDFDPVRAKSLGSSSSLPASLESLFPDTFEESELGQIPSGWTVGSLDQIAHFLNGLALQRFPPNENGSLPVIKIAQLKAGNTEGADLASPNLDPGYIVQDGDVLFSWSGSLECVVWSGGKGALNQHLFKVTSKDYPKWFFYLWIHRHLDEFRRIAAAKATTMGHIQRYHLSEAKILLPHKKLLDAADRIIGPLIESINVRAVQSKILGRIRDLLLPKLISGELAIEDDAEFGVVK
ncbi:restriction modification system S subunit [Candidatus Koribacter versatilis Ellin345]|uniref:Restriction modification system S subunit n=1 Tax=Koribacter versatilis (strain Ellin345) TaxID=204669 RepID=Q1IK43_KORVE|nr:restriction endonuclease subunit S [Candidatus Koribacter versatilis]ABF42757.1 restriction modification system S subunit [Candidatus Koribacter versatilis Ellin345]